MVLYKSHAIAPNLFPLEQRKKRVGSEFLDYVKLAIRQYKIIIDFFNGLVNYFNKSMQTIL